MTLNTNTEKKSDGSWDLIHYTPGIIFNSGDTRYISVCTLSPNKVLVVYSDFSRSCYGTACVVSINDTTITVSDAKVFNRNYTDHIAVCALAENKVLVAYRDDTHKGYGTVRILTVEDSTITVSEPTIFNKSNTSHISLCALSENKVLVAYRTSSHNWHGDAKILSITGTTIKVGEHATFNKGNTYYIAVCPLSEDKVVVVYSDANNHNYGTARLLSISGTTITVGSATVFHVGNTSYITVSSISEDRIIVAYSNNYCSIAQLLTVTGTNIQVGNATVFNEGITESISSCVLAPDKILVVYSSNSYSTAMILTVSNTIIMGGPPFVLHKDKALPGGPNVGSKAITRINDKVLVGSSVYTGNTWQGYLHLLYSN